VLVFLLGIYLVQEGDWSFGSLWVSLAMLGD
jgi:hypothetical protein